VGFDIQARPLGQIQQQKIKWETIERQRMRTSINGDVLENNMLGVLEKMGEGNPGALSVLTQLLELGVDGLTAILDLDDMNIRGEQVWLAYKDHCNQDLDLLTKLARKRDEDMVNTVNDRCSTNEVAVKNGGSYGR
jgi:hypothetical protein